MTEQEHKIEVDKLKKLEEELTNLICLTDDRELYKIYLEWSKQRNVCNEGFVGLGENKLRALEAIELMKNAGCGSATLDAIAVGEEVDWTELDELKDQWNDYLGDAQKYLP